MALCCKAGKHGLSFVEAARREQSGECSHRHCIQSGRQKKKRTLVIYRKMEVAMLGQTDIKSGILLQEVQEML